MQRELGQQAQCHFVCPQLGMYPFGDSNFCHSACVQEWLQKQHLCWSQVLMGVNEYANPQRDWSPSKIHLYLCLYSCTVLCIIKKKKCVSRSLLAKLLPESTPLVYRLSRNTHFSWRAPTAQQLPDNKVKIAANRGHANTSPPTCRLLEGWLLGCLCRAAPWGLAMSHDPLQK